MKRIIIMFVVYAMFVIGAATPALAAETDYRSELICPTYYNVFTYSDAQDIVTYLWDGEYAVKNNTGGGYWGKSSGLRITDSGIYATAFIDYFGHYCKKIL